MSLFCSLLKILATGPLIHGSIAGQDRIPQCCPLLLSMDANDSHLPLHRLSLLHPLEMYISIKSIRAVADVPLGL